MFTAFLIGVGATVFLDLTSVLRTWAFKAPSPNFAMVGRWFAYVVRGRPFHSAIAKSAPVTGENLIGWVAHYGVGIGFAAVLLTLWPD